METGGIYIDQSKFKRFIGTPEATKFALEGQILELYDKRKKSDRGSSVLPEWREVFDLHSNKDKRDALMNIGVN